MNWSKMRASRLDELRRRAAKTQDDLIEETGIPRSTLQRILKGQGVPEPERLAALLRAIGAREADLDDPEETAIVEVPIYDIEVAAGPGRFLQGEAPIGTWPFPREWIEARFGSSSDLALLKVAGDSQEPELRDGDSVMIDLNATRVREGMHVVRLGETLVIKRIQPEGRTVRLVSNNPAYPPVVVDVDRDPSNFDVVGKAVWVGKLL